MPPEAIRTPCAKTPVRFNTAGDLVDAYQIRDADFDVCAAKVKGINDWVQRSAPKVIPAPVPPSRPFSFHRKRKQVVS